jgi:hypothetical protein
MKNIECLEITKIEVPEYVEYYIKVDYDPDTGYPYAYLTSCPPNGNEAFNVDKYYTVKIPAQQAKGVSK